MLPWGQRMPVRPQSASGIARLRFQSRQPGIGRVPAKPPRVAGPHQLLVEVASIGQRDVPDRPPIAIHPPDGHDDGLPEREADRTLLRPRAEGLAFLGSIDPMQTNDRRAAVVENCDRVAITDADHSATELLRVDRTDQTEGKKQGEA
jgi:hypothetical protein